MSYVDRKKYFRNIPHLVKGRSVPLGMVLWFGPNDLVSDGLLGGYFCWLVPTDSVHRICSSLEQGRAFSCTGTLGHLNRQQTKPSSSFQISYLNHVGPAC